MLSPKVLYSICMCIRLRYSCFLGSVDFPLYLSLPPPSRSDLGGKENNSKRFHSIQRVHGRGPEEFEGTFVVQLQKPTRDHSLELIAETEVSPPS